MTDRDRKMILLIVLVAVSILAVGLILGWICELFFHL